MITKNKFYIGYFGDFRLQNKGLQFYEKICHNLTINIKKLAEGRRDLEISFHRFLDNYSVSKQEIESTIANHANKNCIGVEHVLIINDTTEVAFPSQKNKKDDFGPTGYFDHKGFFVHPNIVVNPETEEVLGLAGCEIWKRANEKISDKRAKKAIKDKESYKWISNLIKGRNFITEVKSRTFVTDRESDIYEYISYAKNDFFILRASHNRKLNCEEDENIKLISSFISKKNIADSYVINLQETRKRRFRKALLNLKYGRITIVRPKKIKNKDNYPETIELNIVYVEEDITTSITEKNKVKWQLLTNHNIQSIAEAKKIVYYYKLRWTIEPMFASFKKKGLGIESSQLEEFKKLEKLVLLGLNACIKIFCLVKGRDESINTELGVIFSKRQIQFLKDLQPKLEGRTKKQKNNYDINTMPWAAWIIAKLGSWNGYASDRTPGWQTMYDGLQKFNNMYEGWLINTSNT